MNCFNGARFLNEAIQSVYDQNYSNFEIIFWDNNSSDDSVKIAKDFGDKIKIFVSPVTTTLGSARNSAIKKAKGKYICFLDTDDMFVNNKFFKQVKLMSESKLMMSYGSARFFRGNKTIWIRKAKNKSGYLLNNLLRTYEIVMNTVMLDRKLINNVEFSFNPDLKYSPDYNLFMNIALKYEIGVLNEVIGNYRVHEDSWTRKLFHIVANEQRFTLNQIAQKDKNITIKYAKNYFYSQKKTYYYEAIAHISDNNYPKARGFLKKIIFDDFLYFSLYFLLCLPINNQTILKILKR